MKLRTTLFLLFSITILAYTFWWAYRYAMDSPFRITTEEAKRRLANQQFDLILDVRTDAEVRALGIYPGAVHMPAANLKTGMKSQYRDTSMRILLGVASMDQYVAATRHVTNLEYSAKLRRVVNLYLVLTSRDATDLFFIVEPAIL